MGKEHCTIEDLTPLVSEKSIHAALQDMAITRVFVTHRPEAARLADRIFHLDKGRLRSVEKPPDAGKRIVGTETLAPSVA